MSDSDKLFDLTAFFAANVVFGVALARVFLPAAAAGRALGFAVLFWRFLALKGIHPVNLGGESAGMVGKTAKCVKLTYSYFRKNAMAS